MDVTLETQRLLLRPLALTDVDAFFKMNNNPNVSRFLRNPLTTVEQTRQYLQKILHEYEQNGIGRFAVVLKENQQLIGFSGLKYRSQPENGHAGFYDIGYRFSQAFWGNGFATEAAQAWLDYAFDTMKLGSIHACADKENKASNHLLQKIGFQFVNEYFVGETTHNWYTIIKS